MRLAVSEKFAQLLDASYGIDAAEWAYLPNMVSDRFAEFPLATPRVKPRGSFVFCSVGGLSKNKGTRTLILAFAQAFSLQAHVKLVIGGDGPEAAALRTLVNDLRLSAQVKFLGPLTRDGVLAAMSECDALVVACRFETFSVVLIEALALGKPVIATRCGGPESIVSPQDGLLVDPGSVEAMASALSELHSSSFNFEPEGIRARCIARFGRAALTTRLMKIYDSVINREDHHG